MPLTNQQAQALFLYERARFLELFAFPSIRTARLVFLAARCTPDSPCRLRDVAWTEYAQDGAGVVTVLRRLLLLPQENFLGVIRHELGHLAAPRWSDPEAEGHADAVACLVAGEPICYDRDLLQTVGPGTWPRPRSLHR